MKIQWLKNEIENSITNKKLGDAVIWQKKKKIISHQDTMRYRFYTPDNTVRKILITRF
jgi:hypothetical protein